MWFFVYVYGFACILPSNLQISKATYSPFSAKSLNAFWVTEFKIKFNA